MINTVLCRVSTKPRTGLSSRAISRRTRSDVSCSVVVLPAGIADSVVAAARATARRLPKANPMQADDTTESVIKVIRHTLPRIPKADLEPPLTEDMDLNSLEIVELVLALENEFDIKILNDAAVNLRSTRNIIDVVAQQINVAKPE
jgi:acyl carrier protein